VKKVLGLPTSRARRSGVPLLPLLVTALLPVVLGTSGAAAADLNLNVKITVERLEGHDFGEDPDFYAFGNIDGTEFNNEDTPETEAFEDTYTIDPNWEFSKSVPLSKGNVGALLEIRDEDGFLRLDDDQADLDPDGGDGNLSFNIQLAPCVVSGDANGPCGTFTSEGTGDERAFIRYRIEVAEPASAPGMRVRCMHTPLWPQPGDPVTITAESLDGALAPELADQVQIWHDDRNAPAQSVSNTTVTHTFTAGSNFSYGCRVVDDGVPIFTGWRITQVGPTPDGRAVPVIFTGGRGSRVDLAFVGDRDNYSGPGDGTFQTDVSAAILTAYYSFDIFLTHQDQMNFWLSEQTGNAEDSADGCDHEAPEFTWADAGILLHSSGANFRDCAPGGERIFSSSPGSFNTMRHETGHRPFSLADEYCPAQISGKCDGGYYESEPFPNVYEEPEDCQADAPNLGRPASACREFEEDVENWVDTDWSISDPPTNDLMVDNTTPQANDIRRINWYFGTCQAAAC